mmetsp:Transcript_4888/g.12121  ORF Transcript_4888/g.12121 Transcript_4888/m.12121 type:complete len:401 (-) Transcript_4888:212-1414(-)
MEFVCLLRIWCGGVPLLLSEFLLVCRTSIAILNLQPGPAQLVPEQILKVSCFLLVGAVVGRDERRGAHRVLLAAAGFPAGDAHQTDFLGEGRLHLARPVEAQQPQQRNGLVRALQRGPVHRSVQVALRVARQPLDRIRKTEPNLLGQSLSTARLEQLVPTTVHVPQRKREEVMAAPGLAEFGAEDGFREHHRVGLQPGQQGRAPVEVDRAPVVAAALAQRLDAVGNPQLRHPGALAISSDQVDQRVADFGEVSCLRVCAHRAQGLFEAVGVLELRVVNQAVEGGVPEELSGDLRLLPLEVQSRGVHRQEGDGRSHLSGPLVPRDSFREALHVPRVDGAVRRQQNGGLGRAVPSTPLGKKTCSRVPNELPPLRASCGLLRKLRYLAKNGGVSPAFAREGNL